MMDESDKRYAREDVKKAVAELLFDYFCAEIQWDEKGEPIPEHMYWKNMAFSYENEVFPFGEASVDGSFIIEELAELIVAKLKPELDT